MKFMKLENNILILLFINQIFRKMKKCFNKFDSKNFVIIKSKDSKC